MAHLRLFLTSLVLSASILSARAGVICTSNQPELMINPSFEDGMTGWSLLVPGSVTSVQSSSAVDGNYVA